MPTPIKPTNPTKPASATTVARPSVLREMVELGQQRDAYDGWGLRPTPAKLGLKPEAAFAKLEAATGTIKNTTVRIRNEDFEGAVKQLRVLREQVDLAIKDLGGK